MSDQLLHLLGRCVSATSIKKASPRHGGEYHSPCPCCGGNDRFIVFPEQAGGDLSQQHGVTGTWACPRHCQTGGDSIAFCTTFLGMTFPEACAELGIELPQQDSTARRRYRPLRPLPAQQSPAARWTPSEYTAPSEQWRTQSTKLAEEAHQRLLESPPILSWLAGRGLPLEAVILYGLGYIEGEDKSGTCIFRQRSVFDLPLKTRTDGRVVRVLCIPRGVTIPCWSDTDPRQALRVRIRRRDVDIDKNNPKDRKFQLIPQGGDAGSPYSAPLTLPPVSTHPALATWVIVESEMDAMAVHYACGGRVGVMSVLTVTGKPDKAGHAALAASARILVAVDFEQNDKGEYHTATAWNWWEAQYPQAKLWPVPQGKDPGDAARLGVDLARWVFLAMPEMQGTDKGTGKGTDKGTDTDKGAAEDTAQTVGACRGGASVVEGKEHVRYFGKVRLPSYMAEEDIPADVLELARLWRGNPITFRTFRDASGNCQGFEWDVERGWKREHKQEWAAFHRLQDDSKTVWQWISDHVDTTINGANFLYLWGDE